MTSEKATILYIPIEAYEETLQKRDFAKMDLMIKLLSQALPGFSSLDSIERVQKLKMLKEIEKKQGKVINMPHDTKKDIFLIQEGEAAIFVHDKKQ